jgi:fatty acid desaturase
MIATANKAIFARFLKAYLSLAAMIAFILTVSLANGAGWRVLLVGLPLFLVFFVGITYQLIKEIRALKRQGSK